MEEYHEDRLTTYLLQKFEEFISTTYTEPTDPNYRTSIANPEDYETDPLPSAEYRLRDQNGEVSLYTVTSPADLLFETARRKADVLANRHRPRIKLVNNKEGKWLKVLVEDTELPTDTIYVETLPNGDVKLSLNLTVKRGINGLISYQTIDMQTGTEAENSVKLESRRLDIQ